MYCMNEAELVDVALAVLAEVSPGPPGRGGRTPTGLAAGRARGSGQGARPPAAAAPWGLAGGVPLGARRAAPSAPRGAVRARPALVVFPFG